MLFPVLAIFLCLVAFLMARSKYAAKKEAQQVSDFWERENDANSTPRQDISSLDYIKIPDKILAFCQLSQDEILDQCQKTLQELSTMRILNLTGKTNTELKKAYGPANLPDLMTYDENFTSLVRCLNQLGHQLKELGYSSQAIEAYEFAILCGSDIADTYVQLALLYKKAGNTAAFRQLEQRASALQGDVRQRVLSKLNFIK